MGNYDYLLSIYSSFKQRFEDVSLTEEHIYVKSGSFTSLNIITDLIWFTSADNEKEFKSLNEKIK